LTDADLISNPSETPVETEARESRGRRGRRGGRGRGGREGHREPRAIIEYAAGATPVVIEIAAPVSATPVTIIEYAGAAKSTVSTVTTDESGVSHELATEAPVTAEVVVAPAAQPARRPNPRRRTPRPAEPEMLMIETAPLVETVEVAASVAAAPTAIDRKPRRRTRRPREAASELVMVETQND
jgi:hypothetical protein